MSKKYLSVAFAYVGVIIGAGLASGQDLLQYFLSFGAKGLIGIAVLGVRRRRGGLRGLAHGL